MDRCTGEPMLLSIRGFSRICRRESSGQIAGYGIGAPGSNHHAVLWSGPNFVPVDLNPAPKPDRRRWVRTECNRWDSPTEPRRWEVFQMKSEPLVEDIKNHALTIVDTVRQRLTLDTVT